MFFVRCYFCVSMLAALLRALFFAFQRLQRHCEHCFLRFGVCSVTASIVFCVSAFAALLRALFFAFYRLQRYCEHCFLRFIACSVTASIVFCVLSLAALLRALFFAFYRLQRYCEHCFLRFIACSVTASIVFSLLSVGYFPAASSEPADGFSVRLPVRLTLVKACKHLSVQFSSSLMPINFLLREDQATLEDKLPAYKL